MVKGATNFKILFLYTCISELWPFWTTHVNLETIFELDQSCWKKYNLYVYIWKFPSCIKVLSISPFSLDLILLFSNSFLLECLMSLFEFIYYLQQLRSHSSFGCWRRMWVLYWYLFIFRCVVGFLRMFPLLINSKKFLSNLVSTLKKLCKNHLRFGVWVQWISPVAQGHVCMCPLTTSSWNRA